MFLLEQKFSGKVDGKVKEQFLNTYKFSNHYNNKFILLFWKAVYLYKYIGIWLGKIQSNNITWKRKTFTVT